MPGKTANSQRSETEIKAKNLNADDRKYIDKHGAQLSKSTLRAKWIHSPGEQPDRPGQTLATRAHDVIRRWAEARRGQPATVGQVRAGERPRTLRFDFPANGQDGRSSRLKPIEWDQWFRAFDERDLVFLYQEQLRDGRQSNFFRLDNPSREQG